MNINDFSNDIINSLSNCNLNRDYFNSSILNLLDIYSPIRRFLVTIYDNCPWFNCELHKIKIIYENLKTYIKLNLLMKHILHLLIVGIFIDNLL